MNDSPSNTNDYREVQCIYIGSKQAETKEITELRRSRPSKPPNRKSGESQEAFLKRHSRKCQVCHHPDRDAIEGAFVMWRRPKGIAQVYQLTGDSLYRHAVAFDLYTRRRNNLRSVLDNIMERGVETEITGETILGAVKAYTCLDDSNKWIEPTTNVLFSTKPLETRTPLANLTLAPSSDSIVGQFQPPASGLQPPESNRNSQELKIDVTS